MWTRLYTLTHKHASIKIDIHWSLMELWFPYHSIDRTIIGLSSVQLSFIFKFIISNLWTAKSNEKVDENLCVAKSIGRLKHGQLSSWLIVLFILFFGWFRYTLSVYKDIYRHWKILFLSFSLFVFQSSIELEYSEWRSQVTIQ